MTRKERLLQRLDEIGKTLEKKGDALLLLGLGSVGSETERLDDYSDIDFYVIAAPGCKDRFIDRLDWLEDAHPLAYSFKNADVGHKVLFEDGIYGEFAVFEESDMETAGYSKGRIAWKHPSYENDGIENPKVPFPRLTSESVDFALNEALTNLYVGLCRYARGEKLSASRFIEGHALNNILSVLHLLESKVDYYPDPFGNERRLEARYPRFADRLGGMMQGYEKAPESAVRMLEYIEEVYPVNGRLAEEIRKLANGQPL